LDRFARYYAYFLLFATALPALMRLSVPGRVASLTLERLTQPRRRSRHKTLGIISVGGSVVAAVLYFAIWRHSAWLGLGAVIGLFSGFEMVANAATQEVSTLKFQNIVFGLLYAATAVVTWYILLR
jgi:hypothetical protein